METLTNTKDGFTKAYMRWEKAHAEVMGIVDQITQHAETDADGGLHTGQTDPGRVSELLADLKMARWGEQVARTRLKKYRPNFSK